MTSGHIVMLSFNVLPLLQFQKDAAGKAEAAKMQVMAETYGLQALVPKPNIMPHIQDAIPKVLLTTTSRRAVVPCSSAVEQPALLSQTHPMGPITCMLPGMSASARKQVSLATCPVASEASC